MKYAYALTNIDGSTDVWVNFPHRMLASAAGIDDYCHLGYSNDIANLLIIDYDEENISDIGDAKVTRVIGMFGQKIKHNFETLHDIGTIGTFYD